MSEPTPEPKADPSTKSILVIDDDKPTCLYFKTILALDGFQVETAYTGGAALNLLKSSSYNQFDLVVLDLLMPGYSGYEILKELQQPGYQTVPIFIVTAHVLDQGTIDLIRTESNVHAFVAKPVDIKDFKAKAHALLGTAPRPKKD